MSGLVLLATVLTFAILYAPQPILPVLAAEFGVTSSTAALLITATMVPLAIAPVLYGLWLEAASARRMVVIAAALLGLSQLLFALAPGFGTLLAARGMAGALFPAMITALMTYLVVTTNPGRMAQALGAYIAATVAGGFLGRVYSGAVTDWLGWRPAFILLAISLLVTAAFLTRLPGDTRARTERITPALATRVLKRRGVLAGYLMIFALFFSFGCVMNLLPFRLTALSPDMGSTGVAFAYSGYMMGIPIALGSVWLARHLGGQRAVARYGLVLFMAGTLLLAVPSVPVLFVNMFLFSIGMFMVQGTAPALINGLCPEHRGVVNGLYLSFYYSGGALGSWLPGYLYRGLGWEAVLVCLVLMILLAMLAGRALPTTAMVSPGTPSPAPRPDETQR